MSWIAEQSENTSAININGDTATCTNGDSGSPVHVMYKDPADKNGQYFWQIEVKELQGRGSVSVGLTTDQGFQAGWGLKAMKYLGNLSDGSCLLVQSFGEPINQGDKVGILLKLTDADLKMYIFLNDTPLGLAFHIESPYPKPLYPVVSFDSTGKVKISRSQQIPSSLNRASAQFNGVEGDWTITDYPQHPECAGCKFEIKRRGEGQNAYHLHTHVVNGLNCSLEHDPSSNEWKPSHVMSTMMAGPPEQMKKESVISKLISGIQRLDVQGQQQLVIQTNSGEQVRLDRFEKTAPSAVTQNVFA